MTLASIAMFFLVLTAVFFRTAVFIFAGKPHFYERSIHGKPKIFLKILLTNRFFGGIIRTNQKQPMRKSE